MRRAKGGRNEKESSKRQMDHRWAQWVRWYIIIGPSRSPGQNLHRLLTFMLIYQQWHNHAHLTLTLRKTFSLSYIFYPISRTACLFASLVNIHTCPYERNKGTGPEGSLKLMRWIKKKSVIGEAVKSDFYHYISENLNLSKLFGGAVLGIW